MPLKRPRSSLLVTIISLLTIHTQQRYALAQEQLPIFINCGGKNYKDSRGNTWIADAYYNTGDTFSELFWIFGTSDRNLYRSNRYDSKTSKPDLTYDIPVLNGKYDVFLHFAELYSGAQTSGVRVFDMVVEGSVEFPDFDIYAEAGGYTALVKQTTTTVKDGFLTIKFVRKLENPEISGIEIRPSSVPFIASSRSSPAPSFAPSIKPSINPSSTPSLSPSANPSSGGSVTPTEIPSLCTVRDSIVGAHNGWCFGVIFAVRNTKFGCAAVAINVEGTIGVPIQSISVST